LKELSNNSLSFENCVYINGENISKKYYLELSAGTTGGRHFIFSVISDPNIEGNCLAVGKSLRDYAYLGVNKLYQGHFTPRENYLLIDEITLTVEVFSRDSKGLVFDTDQLSHYMKKKFKEHGYAIGTGQPFMVKFNDITLLLTVDQLPDNRVYRVDHNTTIYFENGAKSAFILTGKCRSKKMRANIINPDFDFQKLGIGGLDEQFKEIFRRAFSSRNLPPDVVEKMGAKHVKGILLHGPPGCGKTLTARQIGTMLSAREPKIVNGPEILNKFVGESEANIRKLFEDAEEEQRRLGSNSGLHIIIFDEIDAICKQRGSVQGASGVHDTVVNQLLSKIDGVEPLNNILVIGMTNRPDLIDEALLRPGRFEVKKEIGLPDKQGRCEVLKIHTQKMKDSNILGSDVDLDEIASLTKNFSGAELAGLVRAAQSCAFVRHVKVGNKVEYDSDSYDDLKVTRSDFMASLENDIKPAYGSKEEDFDKFMRNGILIWDSSIQEILDKGKLYIGQVKNSLKTPLKSVLLTGQTGSGKTALAVKIAVSSGSPFIKVISAENMIGYHSEVSKSQAIKKIFDDAYKSEMSCVVLDDIERLIDYNRLGSRYSNSVVQTIMNLLKRTPPEGRGLLIIATSSELELLQMMQMTKLFDSHIHVPSLTDGSHLDRVLDELDHVLTEKDRQVVSKGTQGLSMMIGIGRLISKIRTSEEVEDHKGDTLLNILREEAG